MFDQLSSYVTSEEMFLRDGSFVIRRYYVCGNHRNKGATVC